MANTPNKLSKKMMYSPYTVEYLGAGRDAVQGYENGDPASSISSYGMKGGKGRNSSKGFQDPDSSEGYIQSKKGKKKFPKNATVITAFEPDSPSKSTMKEARRANKRARKERDYFFIMRKGVCFFIFLFCLLIVAVMGLGFVVSNNALANKILPTDSSVDEETAASNAEVLETLNKFTAIYVKPDNTPQSVRDEYESQIDEEGYYLVFDDTSTYYGFGDPMFGSFKGIGLFGGNAEEEVDEAFADTEATITEETNDVAVGEEQAATEEGGAISFDSPLYDTTLTYLQNITNEDDTMAKPATIIFQYSPLVIYIVIFVTAFVAMITSFLGMFGKRIFKGFGAAGIVILVMVAIVAFNGLAVLGMDQGAPYYDEETAEVHSVINADNVSDYLLHSVTGAPATEVDPEVDVEPVTFSLGMGTLIITGLGVVTIVFSMFARRKVPYSIFDK